MKSYWISYVMYKDGAQGFGNSVFQTEDPIFHAPTVGIQLASQHGAKAIIVLFYKEVPNEMYDKSLARDASLLEAVKNAGAKPI